MTDGKGIPLGVFIDPPSRKRWRKKSQPVSWIRYAKDAHLITIGPTGSGKARDVQIPALLWPHAIGSALIIDPKGQLAAVCGRARQEMGGNVVMIDPFDLLRKLGITKFGAPVGFNPMLSLDPTSPAFGNDCDSLADAIILPTGNDTHWPESAKQLVSGLIMYFAKYGPVEQRNLVSIRSIIGGRDELFQSVIKAAMKTDDFLLIERLSRFADPIKEDGERRSILSTAKTQTLFMGSDAMRNSLADDSGFTFSVLRQAPTTAFIILPAEHIDTGGKWFRLVVGAALRELMHNSKGEPVLMMLDEFANMGYMKSIETAMSLARGYGVKIWPILQHLSALKDLYGENFETFLSGAGAVQYFAPRDQFTSDYISKRCGTRTMYTRSKSVQQVTKGQAQQGMTGVSYSYSTQPSPLLLPEDARAMHSSRQLLFIDGLENILASRFPYYTIPELQGRYDPDPYEEAKRR